MLIWAFLTTLGLDLSAWTILWDRLRAGRQKQILLYGPRAPSRLPIVDGFLERLAGPPKDKYKTIAIIAFLRRLINTKAFEYIVAGLTNSDSDLRKYLSKKPVIVRV